MERLTARDQVGNAYFPECFKEPCGGGGCTKDHCEFLDSVCDKLAGYEEQGEQAEKLLAESEAARAELGKRLAAAQKMNAEMTDAQAVMVREFEAKLEELERVKAERSWISVKDRLPERTVPHHDVLVYHDLNCGMYIDRAWYSREKNKWRNVLGMNLKVTHWMPLPEPPEKEEKIHEKTDD